MRFLLILVFFIYASAFPASVGPENVLVLYSLDWTDDDGNGQSDSKDLAEYYALRRGVPSQNLLGVHHAETEFMKSQSYMDYSVFYDSILTKVYQKLESYDGSVQFKDKIYYICVCYGVPLTVKTYFDDADHPIWPDGSYGHSTRSLDQWLFDIEENYLGGYEASTGRPTSNSGGYLGVSTSDIRPQWYNNVSKYNSSPQTFMEYRNAVGKNIYLVTRLDGVSLMNSASLVDKALYAERYLQNFNGDTSHPYHSISVWDEDAGTDAGHNSHLVNAKRWFDGSDRYSPFAYGSEIGPWDLVVDSHTEGIGQNGHTPEVSGTIASGGVDLSENSLILGYSSSAVVDSVYSSGQTIFVSDATGFSDGDKLYDYYPSSFPYGNVMFYYGYYNYGSYFDVYKFKVGAVGFHMDSGSGVGIRGTNGKWSSKALRRNITATGGAVAEPSSWGIQFGDYFFYALGFGMDFAEASYNSVYYGKRWMAVHVGDPLYAPFRSSKQSDVTSPVFNVIYTKQASDETARKFCIVLAGGDDDKEAEVAGFKIEYGLSSSYGNTVDYEWGWDGADGSWQNEESRYYFYARKFEWEVTGLSSNTDYHYRVSAQDPYGNETVSPNMVFSTSLAVDTGYTEGGNTSLASVNIDFTVSPEVEIYPRPANPSVNLSVRGFPKGREMSVIVYNLRGETVRVLYSGPGKNESGGLVFSTEKNLFLSGTPFSLRSLRNCILSKIYLLWIHIVK